MNEIDRNVKEIYELRAELAEAQESYRLANARIVELLDEKIAVTKERDELKRQNEDLESELDARDEKIKSLSAHETCACSYDAPEHVCYHHSPQLAEANKQIAELKQENSEMKRTLAEPPAYALREKTLRATLRNVRLFLGGAANCSYCKSCKRHASGWRDIVDDVLAAAPEAKP